MLAVNAGPSQLRRAAHHSATPRQGAGRGREHTTPTLRATGSTETLCTLVAPLVNTRGLLADCCGFAVTCCVEEEGEGWVIKRSRTGAGFATLRKLTFVPLGFAVSVTTDDIWVAGPAIMHVPNYQRKGWLRNTLEISKDDAVVHMDCLRGRLIYITAAGVLYSLDKSWMTRYEGGGPELLASHVKPSGGLALFPTANKLLFISDRASLCELDMESNEYRVMVASLEPEACQLRSWNEQHALLTVRSATGLRFYSCSLEGEVRALQSTDALTADADFCVNSQGDVLFFEHGENDGLPCLHRLPRLLPTIPVTVAQVRLTGQE
ncbi:hypothetical protein QJQ45_007380 [Haematococcus lacustris]|nr:hypothetical protein QJQ45_007380 [Haematococcus lacustris]